MSAPALLDLDDETRRALELDAVLTFAASFAASAPGRRLIAGTIPSADRAHLAAEHEAVAEAARHLERWGRFVPGGLPDPSPCLASLSVDALDVEAMPLRISRASSSRRAPCRRVSRRSPSSSAPASARSRARYPT